MKIAVFNCPEGITPEGLLKAFRDAGLPASYLNKKAEGIAKVAASLRYFKIKKCFVRNLGIGRKGNPAVLRSLQGFILHRIPVPRELVTAEGAEILDSFCEREISIPSMRLERVGFGPGHLQISIGETVAPYRRERILLLETNIDDMNPQGFELLYERLFRAGALDVWVETILMKKMRPAFKLSVLLNHMEQDKISEVIFRETSSRGVRFLELDRFSLPRKTVRVQTPWGRVRFKVGFLDSQSYRASPEYEDVKRIAQKKNLSFQRLYEKIKKKWRSPSFKI